MFLFIIPLSFAEISITVPEKDVYNLGEKIAPTVSIKQDEDYNGFFKMYISCDKNEMQYYTFPLNLEAGSRMQVTVPELLLFSSMQGHCSLKSTFEKITGEKIDSEWSNDFFVTDGMDITIDTKLEAEPSDDIIIEGLIKKHSSELLNGEAEISFEGEKTTTDIILGKLEHTIHISYDAEAGNIPLTITAKDKHNNQGEKTLQIKVIPIPTKIKSSFENSDLIPGETLKAMVVLYDHNSKIMDSSINVKILDPDENLIAEKEIKSSNNFQFKTESSQMPGNYFVLSSSGSIKEQNTFTIEVIRKSTMRQENSLVHVENIGNVDYNDEKTIILERDGNRYLINKKINLKPKETITIDLSKEVPQGVYDIILPVDESTEADTEEAETSADDNENNDETENTKEIVGPQNLIENVQIDDNRPIIKKTADGLSAVTGAVVGTANYISSKPKLASTVLILIILGTVTYYIRGFIIKKVKGKKSETSDLFDDYQFDEKKEE